MVAATQEEDDGLSRVRNSYAHRTVSSATNGGKFGQLQRGGRSWSFFDATRVWSERRPSDNGLVERGQYQLSLREMLVALVGCFCTARAAS